VLAHQPGEFRCHGSGIAIQLIAIAIELGVIGPFALRAVIARSDQDAGGIGGVVPRVAVAIVHGDFAFVSDVPVDAFAVPAGFVGLEVEVIVLFAEVGDAFFAGGAVLAVEGGHLGAGGGLLAEGVGGCCCCAVVGGAGGGGGWSGWSLRGDE